MYKLNQAFKLTVNRPFQEPLHSQFSLLLHACLHASEYIIKNSYTKLDFIFCGTSATTTTTTANGLVSKCAGKLECCSSSGEVSFF